MTTRDDEGLLRELAPQALAAVVRRHGDFVDAEDAVQEALVAAAGSWPSDGRPDNPLGWLIRVVPPDDRPVPPRRGPPATGGAGGILVPRRPRTGAVP